MEMAHESGATRYRSLPPSRVARGRRCCGKGNKHKKIEGQGPGSARSGREGRQELQVRLVFQVMKKVTVGAVGAFGAKLS